MLWLAIHLPHLPLELFEPEENTPLAVHTGPENRPVIHAANEPARAAGVGPGMALGAARSLCHELVAHARDPDEERATLERLALWAQQFTSAVSLQENGLLLEVGGSLRLFDGLEPLLTAVSGGLAELGHQAVLAVAPTPLAAWLLARSGGGVVVTVREELRTALDPLPLKLLELSSEAQQALHGLGLRTFAQCRALPRSGLARRLGAELVHYLDRALGDRPDPRPLFEPPDRFHSRLPLTAEVEHTDALLFAARRLILTLTGFLRSRNVGVLELLLRLEHRSRPASTLTLGLVAPSRDPEHLLMLLRERLDRFELPAPTDALFLTAERFLPLERPQDDLFTGTAAERPAWNDLVERLQARLGEEAVQGLCTVADHRPEYAWRTCSPGSAKAGRPVPARPMWLLPEPRPLEQHNGVPWLDGELQLLRGPERLESGWWNGGAARDYYMARDRHGERFWIYRDRRAGQWHLHGVFG